MSEYNNSLDFSNENSEPSHRTFDLLPDQELQSSLEQDDQFKITK